METLSSCWMSCRSGSKYSEVEGICVAAGKRSPGQKCHVKDMRSHLSFVNARMSLKTACLVSVGPLFKPRVSELCRSLVSSFKQLNSLLQERAWSHRWLYFYYFFVNEKKMLKGVFSESISWRKKDQDYCKNTSLNNWKATFFWGSLSTITPSRLKIQF